MKIEVLSNEERIGSGGFTHKITIPYTDIDDETSGAAFEIFPKLTSSTPTFPAGTVVHQAAIRVSTAFTFTPGTLVCEIGDGGDTDRYIAASTDLKTAAWVGGPEGTMYHVYNAADTIDMIVTAGAGALTSITAGEVIVFLAIGHLNKFV